MISQQGDDTVIEIGPDRILLEGVATSSLKATNFAFFSAVAGTRGPDVLTGSAASDQLDAGSGNDDVRAADGDDRIIAGEGNDAFNGGGGNDTIIFSGLRASYAVSIISTLKPGCATRAPAEMVRIPFSRSSGCNLLMAVSRFLKSFRYGRPSPEPPPLIFCTEPMARTRSAGLTAMTR